MPHEILGRQAHDTTILPANARTCCRILYAIFPGQWLQVKNPATGEVIATVPCMKANDTSAAVAEATSAWPEWSKKVAKERSKIMRKWVPLACMLALHTHALYMLGLHSPCMLFTYMHALHWSALHLHGLHSTCMLSTCLLFTHMLSKCMLSFCVLLFCVLHTVCAACQSAAERQHRRPCSKKHDLGGALDRFPDPPGLVS